MRFSGFAISVIFIVFFSASLTGQRRFLRRMYVEAGTGANISYFDVGGGSPGASFQGAVIYDLQPGWRLGINAGFHRTRGTDEGSSNPTRGYEYRSNLNEISVKALYAIQFKPYPIVKWKRKFEPRIYANLGIIQINPKPNQKLALKSTEEYLSAAPLLSGGIGLSYFLDREMFILVEGGTNITSSDFLEGYTNVLHSSSRDMYHTIMIKFVYRVPMGMY